MGPAMIVKAITPHRFSIVVFGVVQVLIDLEVLWNIVHHNDRLHTFFHTYLGASIIALLTIPLGKILSGWTKRIWNIVMERSYRHDMTVPEYTSWTATILGATIGAYSHVLFDSLYHSDIQPFLPWSDSNPCKGLIAPDKMEIILNVLLIIGLLWLIIGEPLRKQTQHSTWENK
jgi:hypothetical protein